MRAKRLRAGTEVDYRAAAGMKGAMIVLRSSTWRPAAATCCHLRTWGEVARGDACGAASGRRIAQRWKSDVARGRVDLAGALRGSYSLLVGKFSGWHGLPKSDHFAPTCLLRLCKEWERHQIRASPLVPSPLYHGEVRVRGISASCGSLLIAPHPSPLP